MKLLNFLVAIPMLLCGVNGLAQSGPERFSKPMDGRGAMRPDAPILVTPTVPFVPASPGGMIGPTAGLFATTTKEEIDQLRTLVTLQAEKIALLEQQIKTLKEASNGAK